METRTCRVVRAEDGYGFHLHGERGKIGQIIKQVESGSAAELAGLKAGDRVVSVNGENVEQSTHQEVVAHIKSNPNETTLEVVDSDLPKEAPSAVVEKVEKQEEEEVKEEATSEHHSQEESNGVVEEIVAANGISSSEPIQNDKPDLPDKELRPRLATLAKEEGKGYGFNLHSEKGKPGRYIRSVDDDGVAQKNGLKAGDRIIEVNGKNVEFDKHIQVVTAIKESGSSVKILVVDDTSDEFFKKCEMSPNESHVRGKLPTPKTSLKSDDILSMDLKSLKEKSRVNSKKNQGGASDWQKRAALFNSL